MLNTNSLVKYIFTTLLLWVLNMLKNKFFYYYDISHSPHSNIAVLFSIPVQENSEVIIVIIKVVVIIIYI